MNKIWNAGKEAIGELPMSVVMFFLVVAVIKAIAWAADYAGQDKVAAFIRGAGQVA